jgi:hypothetical protein
MTTVLLRFRCFRDLSVILLILSFCTIAAGAVVPVGSTPYGKSYGEWTSEWWQWAAVEPLATNPILDPDGSVGRLNQTPSVWFLAGTFGGPAVERTLTIPSVPLFFPIYNSIAFPIPDWGNPFGGTEAEVRANVNYDIDQVSTAWCEIDGAPVPNVMGDYRVESPDGGFTLQVTPVSLFAEAYGLPPGDYAPAVTDGFWLMLEPLPVGHHEISFYGVSDLYPDGPVDVTYHLTVTPEPSSLVCCGLLAVVSAAFVVLRRRERRA